jgi:hypothetical protein
MTEVPFRVGDTAGLKLATVFQKKVAAHFESKLFETTADASGKPQRTFAETFEWDENLAADPAAKGETGSVVKWKAATHPPGSVAANPPDKRPAAVRVTIYGKDDKGEAVSAEPKDDVLVVHDMIDARSRVEEAAQKNGMSLALTPDNVTLVDFLEPIVKQDQPGWGRWNGAVISRVSLQGDLRFVESTTKTAPKIFCLWIPDGVAAKSTDTIDFVVFFHPAVTGDAGFPPGEANYPYHPRYIRLMTDYVLHCGARQLQLSKRKAVYVFPAGSITNQLGDFTNHAVLLKTLDALCVHLARFGGFKNSPRPQVGRVATACYSFGGVHLLTLMNSCFNAGTNSFQGAFYEKHWRESYCCDPVPLPADRAEFAQRLAKWWKGGADGRCLRLYCQPNGTVDFYTPLAQAIGDPVPTLVYGAKEVNRPNDLAAGKGGATVLETKLEFWDSMFFGQDGLPLRQPVFFNIHGWFPNLFQYDGLQKSLFEVL